MLSICCQASTSPARKVTEAVNNARSAWRTFREHKAAGTYNKRNASAPYRVTVQFPLPVGKSLLNPFADDQDIERIRLLDQSDWPGGVIQQFRALRPLVEALLDGYDAEFVGMLGPAEDGMGIWKQDDTTIVCNVLNITFAKFAALCAGEYGKRPLDPNHTLLVVNPAWTSSRDIGQLWDWKLKQQAQELVDEADWEALYHCEMVRSPSGANGLLHRSYPGPWQLFAAPAEDADELGGCVLESASRPRPADITRALNQNQAAVEREFEQYLKGRRKNIFF